MQSIFIDWSQYSIKDIEWIKLQMETFLSLNGTTCTSLLKKRVLEFMQTYNHPHHPHRTSSFIKALEKQGPFELQVWQNQEHVTEHAMHFILNNMDVCQGIPHDNEDLKKQVDFMVGLMCASDVDNKLDMLPICQSE